MRFRFRNRLCSVLLAALLGGCHRQSQDNPAAHQQVNYFKTHFQEECQYIVETVLSDLVEMAGYVNGKQVPANFSVAATEGSDSQPGSPVYAVSILVGKREVVKGPLPIKQPIWSPQLYVDFAKKLLAGAKATATLHDAGGLSVLEALTDLQPQSIEMQNERISNKLDTEFSDPTLHEMAAVILGAFALREFSGSFDDVRSPLCRMTAHLALARALSGGTDYGINGRVAEVMLFTLMNNQKAALERLKPLQGEPKLAAWVRALHARNTYDYRELQDASSPTLLERIMYYQAISRCIDADAGWERVPENLRAECSDFCRIARTESGSVSLGHDLGELALPAEFAEIEKVHSLIGKGDLSEKELIAFLNQAPERCFTTNGSHVRVIGPGQWAVFLQRHLCHALQQQFNFLQRKWGVPEAAREFAAESDKRFAMLRLYPFVRRFNCTTEDEYRRAVEEGIPVTVATPQLISPEVWNSISDPPGFEVRYRPPANNLHLSEWHRHNPPPGTACNAYSRLCQATLMQRPDSLMALDELHEIAPYDGTISYWLLWYRFGQRVTYAQAEEVFRPVLEYSARQIRSLASYATNDSTRFEEVMNRYAKLNPYGYFELGHFFTAKQDEAKAAAYFEKGVELGTDAVSMANNCDWLVKYYFRNGKLAQAESLADRAAEVYSCQGLETKAELLELEEKYDEALDYYMKIEERYDRGGPVVGFCVRYKAKTGVTRFDGLVEKRLKTLFPRGIEKVGLQDFKSPPELGVLIAEENELLRQASLKAGNVIVALDGIRVYDMTQYQYIRELTKDLEIKFLVWNGAQYSEVKASPPNRRFGVAFTDFRRPKSK